MDWPAGIHICSLYKHPLISMLRSFIAFDSYKCYVCLLGGQVDVGSIQEHPCAFFILGKDDQMEEFLME